MGLYHVDFMNRYSQSLVLLLQVESVYRVTRGQTEAPLASYSHLR
jgi:hypothetical protein